MNRIVPQLLFIGAAAGLLLGLRAVIAKYSVLVAVAAALWNDPEVKKIRRRAAKHLKKATKSAAKAARKAEKAAQKAVHS